MTRRRITWGQHQRYRRQALLAGALSADIAHRISAGEANARKLASRAIGKELALGAKVHFLFDDRGGMRVFLTGALDKLTEAQAEAIEALSRKQAA